MSNDMLGTKNKILMVMTQRALESLNLDEFEWIHMEKLESIDSEEEFADLVKQLRVYTNLPKGVSNY